MSSPRLAPAMTDWIDQLSELDDRTARNRSLRAHRHEYSAVLVDKLYDEVVRLSRADLRRAGHLAEAASFIAGKLGEDAALAQGLRATGHVLYLSGKNQPALERYEEALNIFRRLGRHMDAARTISGGMLQTMIYLGQYSRALALAAMARRIFALHKDPLRLARLDSNQGNIRYRQDKFQQALGLYQRAYAYLRRAGDPQDIAIALRNMAVCYISLNRYPDALATYRKAREFCQRHRLPLLALEADYNIAYLHFLRGEYTAAIKLYDATRELCQQLGDRYHRALCDLDQSEMYLELNLNEGGEELAQSAYLGFRELRMNYEAAKALTFLALAISHQGKADRALARFDEARELFVRERNRLWLALIDLYKAIVLDRQGDGKEARVLASSALRFFAHASLPGKAAICELLLARLDLKAGKPRAAHLHCASALRLLSRAEAPAIGYQAYFVLGQVKEALGDLPGAAWAYRQSRATMEDLRSHLAGEELKIAFLKDKLEVYESLVWITVNTRPGPGGAAAALSYMEEAKSRSLADLISFQAHALEPRSRGHAQLGQQLNRLRDKLNLSYRQIEMEEQARKKGARARIARLRRQTRRCEDEMVRAFDRMRKLDREFVEVQNPNHAGLDAIQSSLPQDSLLLEYYHARGEFYACLVPGDRIEMVRLGPVAKVLSHLRLLQFQLSKFRLGKEYLAVFGTQLEAAARFHLTELYRELVAPIRERLQARHLIIVPHGILHHLPFQALNDGTRWLCEDFSLSYAPSAGVFQLCATKRVRPGKRSLVLGIADPLAPYIRDEAQFVASRLPNSTLFLDEEAVEEHLREQGPASRFIHIATHGLFRRDNPMFSSIRLGKSQLRLLDLYQLRLSAELVTLSGCGTGLSVVVGGDELLGLSRGLLYAGAQAVLVTLWDVNDESAAEFMRHFYDELPAAPNKAVAMQRAMASLRATHPHPYHWAPFVLIGKYA